MSLLIGLDVGTTSVKAGLYAPSGQLLGAAAEEYLLDHPGPDRAQIDPDVYWTATRAAIGRALSASRADPEAVAAIAVSSQGETVIAVDEDGRPLAPALVWLDNRATQEALEIAQRFDDATVYAVTGVPSVVPTWTACKILWWRGHEPDVFARARRFLLVEDFILHRLTGRFVTEGGVACTSLLFDIVGRRWWEPMLEMVGIGPERLPELVAPGAVVGTLTPAAAEALGVPGRTLVVAGGMDQGAGAVGVGNVGPDIVSESSGGALTLQASVDRHDGDPTRQTPVYIHSAPARYLFCPVCPTGGMALTWFRNQFGADEMAAAEREGGSAYDLLTALAAPIAPGADGLTMLPHLMGAFSPEYEPGLAEPFTASPSIMAKGTSSGPFSRLSPSCCGATSSFWPARGRRRGRYARTEVAPAAHSGTRSRPTPAVCRWSPSRGRTRRFAATPCWPASPPASTRTWSRLQRPW